MNEEDESPEPEDDARALFERLGLASITSNIDQLRASLVGYAECVNAVYVELLNYFPEKRAQKMAAVLWDRLVVPVDDDEAYEVPES